MSKLREPSEVLTSLGISTEDGCGKFKGRNVRLLYTGNVDVGDDNFDRWANSTELSFDLLQKKGQRSFMRWANSFEGKL